MMVRDGRSDSQGRTVPGMVASVTGREVSQVGMG